MNICADCNSVLSMNKRKYYVYEDWTLEDNSRCFYVGKGDLNRIKTIKRNKKHTNIVNKYGVNRIVIFETYDELASFELEIEKITEHKTYVHGDDLTFGANFTKGGEGASGAIRSDETKQKMRKAISGYRHSSERKLIIKERTTAAMRTPEVYKKMSDSHKGKSPWNKGKILSEEGRKKLSISHMGQVAWNKGKTGVGRITPIVQMTLDEQIVEIFQTIKQASEKNNVSQFRIRQNCRGKTSQVNGYIYKLQVPQPKK